MARPPAGNRPGHEHRLGPGLDDNLRMLRRLYRGTDDMVIRRFRLGLRSPQAAAVVYLGKTVDESAIARQVIEPLARSPIPETSAPDGPVQEMAPLREYLVSTAAVRTTDRLSQTSPPLAAGAVALLVDGVSELLVLSLPATNISRAVAEPQSSPVVRGSREGFVESLERNLALLRNRVQTPELRVRYFILGRRTQTRVAVLYLHGVTEEKRVREVMNRLARIDIDGVIESGQIEELIQDNPYTLFPTVRATERVDVVSGSLLEGRLAIVTDGTPFVLIVPVSLTSLLQVSEDYNLRWPLTSFVRWVRYVAALIAVGLTAFYVAVISFNHEALPIGLLLREAGNRFGLPFPAMVEALLLEAAFEILREAGLRMPRPIGQAISIVGVLVLGEAAVRAGIVGPVMIIVVGTGALSSFAIPDYTLLNAFRLARFGMILLAGSFGLFGWMWGALLITTHLLTLKSFGVPYLSPMAPLRVRELLRDDWLRAPWWAMGRRPKGPSRGNGERSNQPPPGPNRTGTRESNS
jgi:spore germination protein KA